MTQQSINKLLLGDGERSENSTSKVENSKMDVTKPPVIEVQRPVAGKTSPNDQEEEENGHATKEKRARAVSSYTKSTSKIIDWDYDSLPVKIPIPPQLRKQLNDDSMFVNQSRELVPLPRIPSAGDILENWAREYASAETTEATEIINMLKILFQQELGNHLLFRLERFQYAEFLSRNPGVSVDKAYGAEHLLRLFVILPWFLSNAELDESVIHSVKIVVANLMEYMRLNMGTFFCQEYEPASNAALQDAGLS